MTFNAYISLDGLKYTTLQRSWRPVPTKSSQDRLNLDGSRDVTYGPAAFTDYVGEIVAPVTPKDTGWGDYSDLMETIAKTEYVSFTDHYGSTCNVHVLGPFDMKPVHADWASASNIWYVTVRIVAA
jgi:hypothetical protein